MTTNPPPDIRELLREALPYLREWRDFIRGQMAIPDGTALASFITAIETALEEQPPHTIRLNEPPTPPVQLLGALQDSVHIDKGKLLDSIPIKTKPPEWTGDNTREKTEEALNKMLKDGVFDQQDAAAEIARLNSEVKQLEAENKNLRENYEVLQTSTNKMCDKLEAKKEQAWTESDICRILNGYVDYMKLHKRWNDIPTVRELAAQYFEMELED